MSDCPYCDWRYDPTAPCVPARQVGGSGLPVVWDGHELRVGRGSESPTGRREAAGAHMCDAHPLAPEVLLLGPVERYTPLAAINALLTAWAERPTQSLLFGLRRKDRAEVRAALGRS